jgi:hypothetical protein
MHPQNDLLKRIVVGSLTGGAVGVLWIVVGILRGLFFIARGGHIAPVSPEEIRLLSFYVAGFILAGALISAILPSLRSGLAQYFGFSLSGIVVMLGVLAGDKGGLATRGLSGWIIAILLGIFFGCAFAYGFRRSAA